MTSLTKLLVVDDDASLVSWLVESLEEEGYEAQGETSALRALRRLESEKFDLLISDLEMPEVRGLDLLARLQSRRPELLVLLITAFGSIELAMQAVRQGATDFLPKPFHIETLVLSIERALSSRKPAQPEPQRDRQPRRLPPTPMVAESPSMRQLLSLARRAAESQFPILITGESGVGKGELARYLHEMSPHRKGPLLALNAASLPAGLAEAELFGVQKGAYTDARESRPGAFEQARGGTLFLDELGELALELQPKLLRALENKTIRPLGSNRELRIDLRIIAATNCPLEQAVREGRFRADLYHRLNVIRLEIPPLRQRPEDLKALIVQSLQELASGGDSSAAQLTPEAEDWLLRQPWPGNIRELKNTLARAALLSEGRLIHLEDLSAGASLGPLGGPAELREGAGLVEQAASLELSLQQLETLYIQAVLKRTRGHKGKAAQILGLDRRTLYRKAAELDS